ncbi:MAG: hypothetical protein KF894_33730 [Labilithrix sp.]|nr:hypothetical protein [Labilithrix sp.]
MKDAGAMRPLALAVPLASLLAACSGAVAERDVPLDEPPVRPAETTSTEAAPRDVPQNVFGGDSSGCSNVIAFRATADGTQYAVVEIDKTRLALRLGEERTVDLGTSPDGVAVFVDVYARAPDGGAAYCSDHRTAEPAMTRWSAEAGKLTIALAADPDARDEAAPTYHATLRLETVHFKSPEGGFAVVVPTIVIEDVRVGWLPG